MQKLLENLVRIKITSDFFKSLPETPGIYCYFKDDEVIYVGKAINLKRRVASYFRLDLEPKTAKMISLATHMSFIQVQSEFEALLLEAKLIRSYMPHFNIAAKDDKHPLYIVITKEEFPRVLAARRLIANDYLLMTSYGPFPSSSSVKSVLKLLRRIFPYSDHKLGKRGCLYSHIGLCNPCPNEIVGMSKEKRVMIRKKYLKNIQNIKKILDGKSSLVRIGLEKEMNTMSKLQKYEEAKILRDQINRLDYVTRPQMPISGYMENPNLYEDQRRKELDSLSNILKSYINIHNSFRRIECYDVAHLAGNYPTASMVTFINGEADKTLYRNFRIKKAKGGDDYDSMREVARRRAKYLDKPTSPRLRRPQWGKPDLIIVDGGVGQVKAFTSILYSNVVNIPVVGIAKHPDRLIVPIKSEKSEEYVKIKLTGPALNLVSRMRDEAHRFARRYHHKLLSKSLLGDKK